MLKVAHSLPKASSSCSAVLQLEAGWHASHLQADPQFVFASSTSSDSSHFNVRSWYLESVCSYSQLPSLHFEQGPFQALHLSSIELVLATIAHLLEHFGLDSSFFWFAKAVWYHLGYGLKI